MAKTTQFPGKKSRLAKQDKLDPFLALAIMLFVAGLGYLVIRAFAASMQP